MRARTPLTLAVAALALSLTASPALAHGNGKGHGNGHGKDRDRYEHRYDKRDRDHRHDWDRYYDSHYRGHRDRDYRHDARYRTVYRDRVRTRPVYVERAFVAPRAIYVDRAYDYDPWFAGQVFYAPHHHAHYVYDFPVATPYGIRYRPHAYCGDRLYDDGLRVNLLLASPRFGLSIGF